MDRIKFDNFVLDAINNLIHTGAFLTVKSDTGQVNTMTISWATIGCMWFLPIFMVMVRKSRFTYELIQKTDSFSVSIPTNGQLKKELTICGTKSGKIVNKIEECNLETSYIDNFATPIIKGCDVNILCKTLYKNPLNENCTDSSILEVYGKEKDFHTLFFGEIISIINNKTTI